MVGCWETPASCLDPVETKALSGWQSLSPLPHRVGTNRASVSPCQENIELALADAEPGFSDSVAAVDQPSHQALVSARHACLWLRHGSL